MTTLIRTAAAAFTAWAALALPAHATFGGIPIPEPASWALVAVAIVAAIVAKGRNNRK